MDIKIIFTWLPFVAGVVMYIVMAYAFIVALAMLVGSMVPFVKPMRWGMELFVIVGKKNPEEVGFVLADKLDEALKNRDEARLRLKNSIESKDKKYIDESHMVFSLAEREVEKARWRLDRLIGVAYLAGHGREFKRFVK